MNLQQLMKQAQQMQEKLQKQMETTVVEATAGGGMVFVHLYGKHAAARRRFDNRCFHLFLQLLLHLLGLFHKLLQVHCHSPFAGLICAISPRKTSKNLFTRGSSLAFPRASSPFGCCSFIIRDTETGLPMSSLATASSTALCSLD